MATGTQSRPLIAINRWRRTRRARNVGTLGLVILGPILAFATFLVLGPFELRANAPSLRFILLADLVYVLVVAALVLGQVGRLLAARRAQSAGSRLHLRLIGVFALLALIPTVTVAVFAGLTVNIGLEGWFSDRVRQVVGSSLAAAEAYEDEQREDLAADATALARFLDNSRRLTPFMNDAELRQVLVQGQLQIQRGLREAYVIDGTGEIRARGERSYLFDFERPHPDQIAAASEDGLLIIQDWDNNEFRALVRLDSFVDRFLFVSREVDGEILSLLDETKETVQLYQQLESERGRVLFEFGLLYLGFAVILILAAIWLGMWFAERLSRPVGRLTDAAQQVGAGDLDVQVIEEEGDDEIAMLGRYFNQMTRQLKGQRDTLLDNTEQIERRRRLFDSVLVLGDLGGGRGSIRTGGSPSSTARPSGCSTGRTTASRWRWPRRCRNSGRSSRPCATGQSEIAQDEVKVTRQGRLEKPAGADGHAARRGWPAGGLRGRLRRRHRSGQRPADGGLGRRRPAHRPRDQEPADPDPAERRAHQAQVRPRAGRGPGQAGGNDRRDRAPDQRSAPHRRRVLQVRAHARARPAVRGPDRTCARRGAAPADRPARCAGGGRAARGRR